MAGESIRILPINWPLDNPETLADNHGGTIVKPTVQGVGGVVLDAEGRALVVRLRYGHQQHLWRFPGGYARGTEHVFEAAEREVLEETGVRVKAVSLISLTSTVRGVCLECSPHAWG